MDNNSANSNVFGFKKPDAKQDEQEVNVIPPVEKDMSTSSLDAPVAETKETTIEDYTDIRTVTIMLVKHYSLYRKANDKVLPKRTDFIGSSIHSSRVLSSNKEEIDIYFPNLVGLSPNDPSFVTRVKQYLNNIRVPVDELGITLDISFHYNNKLDYYRIKREEEKIDDEYKKRDKSDIIKLKAALKEKIVKLNSLEGSKCKLGYPINVDDYIVYRHCLFYNDIAKDMALINVDSNIRFYFKDNKKEEERLRKLRVEVNKAKANYVSCVSDNTLFDAVYIQYCVVNNLPVISSLAENRVDREIKLDRFSTDEPIKFNKIFNNPDIKLIANIEMLIARGELIRSQYNQNISSSDGTLIGANMKEAIVWFKDVNNASVVNAYIAKLKNI